MNTIVGKYRTIVYINPKCKMVLRDGLIESIPINDYTCELLDATNKYPITITNETASFWFNRFLSKLENDTFENYIKHILSIYNSINYKLNWNVLLNPICNLDLAFQWMKRNLSDKPLIATFKDNKSTLTISIGDSRMKIASSFTSMRDNVTFTTTIDSITFKSDRDLSWLCSQLIE